MIGNLDFGQNFEKIRFQLNISKIQNVWKISISVKYLQNLDFDIWISFKFPKISILVKNFENIDFDANFWKISNLV